MLRVVEEQASDPIIPVTLKIRESLWKRLKIQAIEEDRTMGEIAERVFAEALAPRPAKKVGTRE